ncbi:ribonuclease E inhibitor RraB [Motilibacter deserti]|uniref:Regulator of ribonuclease activity B domain-containing protein n=1 Tax=Motilibacter deserti TaxID=2714956 RepID=A0ABX0H1Z4_9ACTN|nr:ribonuclease E inhibitor RraB [Motilibacter deserti]NHC15839.1 hypothetical protein [Motilibacter deserti]
MSFRAGLSPAAGALALLLATAACSGGDEDGTAAPAGPSATTGASAGDPSAPAVPPLASEPAGQPSPVAPSGPAPITPSAPASSTSAPARPSPAGTTTAGFGSLAPADQQVVARALARGLKAGQPVAVEHYARFDDQPTLDSVSTELTVLGLTVTPVVNVRESDSFELTATSSGTLDASFLESDLVAVREVVERNGGTYTGWDAQPG